MLDLDKYASTVLGAYGVTLVLIGLLVLLSWRRSARLKRALAEVERAVGRRSNG
jgi:heme exporter protein D